jgi:tetratricopeptide (TPR) repeat protein
MRIWEGFVTTIDIGDKLCFLGKTKVALEAIDQALAMSDQSDRTRILANRGAILVLAGAYEEALQTLTAQLTEDPEDKDLRLTQATCLLHMERYEEAITAYEKASAKGNHWADKGLGAARLGKQPDWDDL